MMSSRRLLRFSWAAVGVTMSLAAPARSQDTPSSEADRLFREGRVLLKAKQTKEACELFERSLALDPALGTILNLAYCYEMEGKTASARAMYQRGVERAREAGDDRRARFAQDRLAHVEARISAIEIQYEGPSQGARVEIDGEPIDGEKASGRIAIDPGEHQVKVSVPGRRAWMRTIHVQPGPATLAVFVPNDALQPLGPRNHAQPRSTASQGGDKPQRAGPRWLAWGVGAVGVAGLGVGSYFGLRALSKKNDAAAHCTGSYCDDDGLRLHEEASTSATWSTVGFAAGMVGVGAGAYLLLAAPGTPASRRTAKPEARLAAGWKEALLMLVF